MQRPLHCAVGILSCWVLACLAVLPLAGGEAPVTWYDGIDPAAASHRTELRDEHRQAILATFGLDDTVAPEALAERVERTWLARGKLDQAALDAALAANRARLATRFGVEERAIGLADLERARESLHEADYLLALCVRPALWNLLLSGHEVAERMEAAARGEDPQEAGGPGEAPPPPAAPPPPDGKVAWKPLVELALVTVEHIEAGRLEEAQSDIERLAVLAEPYHHWPLPEIRYFLVQKLLFQGNTDRRKVREQFELARKELGGLLSTTAIAIRNQLALWDPGVDDEVVLYDALLAYLAADDKESQVYPYRGILSYSDTDNTVADLPPLMDQDELAREVTMLDRLIKTGYTDILADGILRQAEKAGKRVNLPDDLRGSPLGRALAEKGLLAPATEPTEPAKAPEAGKTPAAGATGKARAPAEQEPDDPAARTDTAGLARPLLILLGALVVGVVAGIGWLLLRTRRRVHPGGDG